VTFPDQPPSTHWSALTFRGERLAEVWFKPDGEPLALVFRIPRSTFQIPGLGQRLTAENLLKAVAIAPDAVESWHLGDTSHSPPDLANPLPQPPLGVPHLEVHVRLTPPPAATADEVAAEPAAVSSEWHDLEARWKTVLGLEAAMEAMRKNMEAMRAELEAAMRRGLTADDKVHALAADVAQWTKAKNRAHFALPKANEFIHRATWALGAPERKRLGELFKNPIGAQTSLPRPEDVVQELEYLRKDRQVLSAQGQAVYQECKAIVGDVQRALRTLQSNAASRASQKKGGSGAKGKSF
jgi:hypothetical protein